MESHQRSTRGGRGNRGRGRGRGAGRGRGNERERHDQGVPQVGRQRQYRDNNEPQAKPEKVQPKHDATPSKQPPKELSSHQPKLELPSQSKQPLPSQSKAKPDSSREKYKLLDVATPCTTIATTKPGVAPERKPPARPGFGRKGRPIRLEANHFELTLPKGEIYHYDVEITPGKYPSHINRKVIKVIAEKHRSKLDNCKLAFDGKKNLYTSRPLPSVNRKDKCELEVEIDIETKKVLFKVCIKLAALVSLDVVHELVKSQTTGTVDTASAMQAIDVVLSSMPSMRFAKVGRSYFTSPSDHYLGGGKQMWFGYYQSARPSMWSVKLNLDVSTTAFYKEQPVTEFLAEVIEESQGGAGRGSNRGRGNDRGRGGDRGRGRGRGGYDTRGGDRVQPRVIPTHLNDTQRRVLAKEIKGLRVQVTHLSYPRKYKVKDVTPKPPSETLFQHDDKKVNVEDYFKNEHKKHLQYPKLPCLHMEGKNPHIYIPIEFCMIVQQHCTRRPTDEQVRAMIRAQPSSADVRKREIMNKVEEAKFDLDEYLSDFHMKVSKQMMKVDGRVLDPPILQYKGEEKVTPRDGAWRMNQFYKGCQTTKWGILYSNKLFERDIGRFIYELSKTSNAKGMSLNREPEIIYFKDYREDLQNTIESKFKGSVELIIVILDGNRGISYKEVKRVGDNLSGVRTQCIELKNASKCIPSTMENLCLKINTKLGGTNSIPMTPEFESPIFEKPVIIFGADVTHPAPKDTKSPSLAAVTASMDKCAMEYRAKVKVLGHRQEVFKIDELANIVKNMLVKFYKYSKGCKPERIIFYRDGVSEGQFKEVILNEVAAIQKACKMLEEGYEPGITFVVVQKRHHTRLFCVDDKDKCGKAKNVPPGTTVDNGITHAREFDFFLCSHFGIQGTSRPCHYHILCDDNRFSADDLQTLTYQLCHCYARCNRSVSYPAPTYYSHLAAFRARHTLQDWEGRA